MSEKLCLKWDGFEEITFSGFGRLRNDKDLSDVTLACEDGQLVTAHKVILAASSPFFLNLLRRHKHPNPLIYMKGLKSEDLKAIIDFLYFGEANVDQDRIDGFLSLAEELKLKGFSEDTEDSVSTQNSLPVPKRDDVNVKQNKLQIKFNLESNRHVSENRTAPSEETVEVDNESEITGFETINATVRSLMGDVEELEDMVEPMKVEKGMLKTEEVVEQVKVVESEEVVEQVRVVKGGRWCKCRECVKPKCGACKMCTYPQSKRKCLNRKCVWRRK